jgi:hypothetical protein
MKRLLKFGDTSATLRQVAFWTLLAMPVGLLAGSASALFLWSLDHVTQTRWDHPWLLWLLPVAGFAVGWPVGEPDDMIARQTHAVDWYENATKAVVY